MFRALSVPLLAFLPIALAGLSGCGVLSTGGSASTSCAANTAQIAVFDSQMRRICGCAEASGIFFGPGQALVCTVAPGTVVSFNYVGLTVTHQIVITNAMTFPPRGVSSANQTDGYQFNSTGTFPFNDVYFNVGGSGLGGTIIVQ